MKLSIRKSQLIMFIFLIFYIINFNSCQNINRTNENNKNNENHIIFSTLLNNQELILNGIGEYNNENLKAIIYFVPFHILTRYSLNIDHVKNMYHKKIEIHDSNEIYNFLNSINNKTYTLINRNNFDLRAVVEILNNDSLIFSFSSETGLDIIIDNYMINNGNELLNFMNNYLYKE